MRLDGAIRLVLLQWLMNGWPEPKRSPRVPCRRAGKELHQSSGEAGSLAISAEPDHPPARGKAWTAAVDPHDTQRLTDRSRRAPAPEYWSAAGRDRGRARILERIARETGGDDPDHRW